MTFVDRLVLYFDGASRNNPRGPAGCGFQLVAMDDYGADGQTIAQGNHYLEYNVSNNQAEYQGLIDGLNFIEDNLDVNHLYIRGDSEIVVNQVNGDYQVHSHNIRPYYEECMQMIDDLNVHSWTAKHIYRDRNQGADQLANDAIDYQETDSTWYP